MAGCQYGLEVRGAKSRVDLEVQGRYNQTITVVISHLKASQVEMTRVYLCYKYSYDLTITTLHLQVWALGFRYRAPSTLRISMKDIVCGLEVFV